jgi:uncharacterized protein (TIGR04145 family)
VFKNRKKIMNKVKKNFAIVFCFIYVMSAVWAAAPVAHATAAATVKTEKGTESGQKATEESEMATLPGMAESDESETELPGKSESGESESEELKSQESESEELKSEESESGESKSEESESEESKSDEPESDESQPESETEESEASGEAESESAEPESTVSAQESRAAGESASISVDGKLNEWKAVNAIQSSKSGISQWKVAKSSDGSLLYFCFEGTASTQWYGAYMWESLSISYENGTSFSCQMANLEGAWTTPGASVAFYNSASGNNPGKYAVECVLPMTEADYTFQFAGVEVRAEDIPVFVSAEDKEPVYGGIVIDGDFEDWDAVTCVEAYCPEESNHSYNCLAYAACVFDGDYLYIYLQDGANGSAAGAGVHSNGRYAITTDMGRELVFRLSTQNGGTAKGVKGAEVAYFGKEWEIAIPVSELPLYKESLTFGLYQVEPFLTDITNLQNEDGLGTAGEFTGIVYDGLYGDWDAYPHTLIQYATSGTQTNHPDGEGALYADGSILYGHVLSSMDAHLLEQGGEFASGVSICFNGDRAYNGDKTWNLYPKLVAVDASGTIDWNAATKNLPSGTYEFYILDGRGEYNTKLQTNLTDLAEYDQPLGKMTITVGEENDEMEFYIDLEQAAKFLSHYSKRTIEANDFKLIEAQFGRIGQEYISTAGTSSGPYLGVATCMAFVGLILLKRRRNKAVEA